MFDRMHNKRLGRAGEDRAARFLKRHGYKIVARNYRTPYCEVDIIALKGDVLAFVEVKTRLTDEYGTPSEAVDGRRQRAYCRAAENYPQVREGLYTARLDVIEVTPNGINHLENAFWRK